MRRSTKTPAEPSVPVPDVVASFAVTPFSPSVFDTVRLFDYSYDPGRIGIVSRSWELGDGASTGEAMPAHRYDKDGEYTVTLTVTTLDGRTATAEQSVLVSTHDVAIASVAAPLVARTGETCAVVVSVASRRRFETVQVELLRTTRHGKRERVAALTRTVPGGNGATEFSFPYTFTTGDAAVGAVTFEALATIVGARDALPVDNAAKAGPTIVH